MNDLDAADEQLAVRGVDDRLAVARVQQHVRAVLVVHELRLRGLRLVLALTAAWTRAAQTAAEATRGEGSTRLASRVNDVFSSAAMQRLLEISRSEKVAVDAARTNRELAQWFASLDQDEATHRAAIKATLQQLDLDVPLLLLELL